MSKKRGEVDDNLILSEIMLNYLATLFSYRTKNFQHYKNSSNKF